MVLIALAKDDKLLSHCIENMKKTSSLKNFKERTNTVFFFNETNTVLLEDRKIKDQTAQTLLRSCLKVSDVFHKMTEMSSGRKNQTRNQIFPSELCVTGERFPQRLHEMKENQIYKRISGFFLLA